MITADYFTELVYQNFNFLVGKYNFNYVDTTESPRQIFVNYRKSELMVIIKYSHTNQYVEVSIYKDVPVIAPPEYQLKTGVMLLELIKQKNQLFDYHSIMPPMISLEESVKHTSSLLENYGGSLLSGDK